MYDSDWADDLGEEEYPEWTDEPDDDEVEVVACPHCGAEIYEEAEQCPVCEQYVTRSTSSNISWYWRATAAVLLVCFLYFLWSYLEPLW